MNTYRCDFGVHMFVKSRDGVDLAECRLKEIAEDLVNVISEKYPEVYIIEGGFELVQ